jgi:hypothetical protein
MNPDVNSGKVNKCIKIYFLTFTGVQLDDDIYVGTKQNIVLGEI